MEEAGAHIHGLLLSRAVFCAPRRFDVCDYLHAKGVRFHDSAVLIHRLDAFGQNEEEAFLDLLMQYPQYWDAISYFSNGNASVQLARHRQWRARQAAMAILGLKKKTTALHKDVLGLIARLVLRQRTLVVWGYPTLGQKASVIWKREKAHIIAILIGLFIVLTFFLWMWWYCPPSYQPMMEVGHNWGTCPKGEPGPIGPLDRVESIDTKNESS